MHGRSRPPTGRSWCPPCLITGPHGICNPRVIAGQCLYRVYHPGDVARQPPLRTLSDRLHLMLGGADGGFGIGTGSGVGGRGSVGMLGPRAPSRAGNNVVCLAAGESADLAGVAVRPAQDACTLCLGIGEHQQDWFKLGGKVCGAVGWHRGCCRTAWCVRGPEAPEEVARRAHG